MAAGTRRKITGSFGGNGSSDAFQSAGGFNLSVSGTYAGTISIERSFDEGVTYFTVSALTANAEVQKRVDEVEVGVLYRLTMASYSSGTATYRMSS